MSVHSIFMWLKTKIRDVTAHPKLSTHLGYAHYKGAKDGVYIEFCYFCFG